MLKNCFNFQPGLRWGSYNAPAHDLLVHWEGKHLLHIPVSPHFPQRIRHLDVRPCFFKYDHLAALSPSTYISMELFTLSSRTAVQFISVQFMRCEQALRKLNYSDPVLTDLKYCDEFVCLSVCLRVYFRSYTSDLHQTLYTLPMTVAQSSSNSVARSSPLTALRCCSSSFVDDVIFAHSGPYGGILVPLHKWRHCVVVRRLTPVPRRIDCVVF